MAKFDEDVKSVLHEIVDRLRFHDLHEPIDNAGAPDAPAPESPEGDKPNAEV
jgi:hypothetical protein